MVPRTQATSTPVKRSATLRFSDRVPTQAGFARKVWFRGLELMHRIRFRPAEYSYRRLQDWAVSARERSIVSHTSSEARCVYLRALKCQVRSMTIILEFFILGENLATSCLAPNR